MPDTKPAPNDEPLTLSVFISSPGDLATTRNQAREVINQISGRVIEGRRVVFKAMLYEEHTAALVGYSPQQAVDYFMGCSQAMNIYVGMFWSRMGSEVVIKDRKHPSGTRYEFDSAYKGFRITGQPLMLLYRCQAPPPADSTPDSVAAVAGFFDGFKGLHPQYDGFPQNFASDDDFAALLVRDLDQLARHIIHGTFAARQDAHGQELRDLVVSVRQWLASFEDMFGKDLQENQERERDRLFPVHFRPLLDPAKSPATTTAPGLLPGKDESLLDVFDGWGGRMLMVGERGTGKTFAMLRLMQDLADRAYIRRGDPVPVFFNLSSWSETYREGSRPPSLLVRAVRWLFPQPERSSKTLDQWLEDQLVRNYSVQRRAARRLLGTNRVIFCLDGLDELDAGLAGDAATTEKSSRDLRDACVRAINGTLENRAVHLVLCCREETFHELSVKPAMGAPLQTQMLTADEVIADLRHWDKLEGLKTAMAQSPVLMERARVALFLSMMRIAYQDMNARLILQTAELPRPEWEKHLMDHYVDRCMKLAPPESQGLNKDLIPDCLSWIARQPDNDFLLDDLQPSVLRADGTADGERQWRHYRWFSVLVLALSLMIIESLPPAGSIIIEWTTHAGIRSGLWHGFLMLLLSGLILTPLYIGAFAARNSLRWGICFGLAWALDCVACDYVGVPKTLAVNAGHLPEVVRLFLVSLPCAIIFFILAGACTIFERLGEHQRRYGSKPGIQWHEILPVEPMHWRWFHEKSIWRGGWIGLLIGPLILLIGWLGGELERGLIGAPLNALIICVFSGLSGSGAARVSIEPNQGIARSLRHASFMAGLFVLCGSLTWGGVYCFTRGPLQGLLGAILGLTLAFTFYLFGGIPVIRQFCLGTILHKQGKLPTWCCWPPWRLTVQFLDDLVRYKLLRRSAGGYMFRHQSLREYYRSLPDRSKPG